MKEVEEIIKGHVYIKYEDIEIPIPYYWTNEKGEVDYNRPLTLENVYEWLKYIIEHKKISDKQINETKSEFKKGHRKKMFNDEKVEEIKALYANGLSKNKIAKMYGCSEKTIRNYLKK